ncbi:hypothetical protein L345_07831, partial [Ophiophagus hannah]
MKASWLTTSPSLGDWDPSLTAEPTLQDCCFWKNRRVLDMFTTLRDLKEGKGGGKERGREDRWKRKEEKEGNREGARNESRKEGKIDGREGRKRGWKKGDGWGRMDGREGSREGGRKEGGRMGGKEGSKGRIDGREGREGGGEREGGKEGDGWGRIDGRKDGGRKWSGRIDGREGRRWMGKDRWKGGREGGNYLSSFLLAPALFGLANGLFACPQRVCQLAEPSLSLSFYLPGKALSRPQLMSEIRIYTTPPFLCNCGSGCHFSELWLWPQGRWVQSPANTIHIWRDPLAKSPDNKLWVTKLRSRSAYSGGIQLVSTSSSEPVVPGFERAMRLLGNRKRIP